MSWIFCNALTSVLNAAPVIWDVKLLPNSAPPITAIAAMVNMKFMRLFIVINGSKRELI